MDWVVRAEAARGPAYLPPIHPPVVVSRSAAEDVLPLPFWRARLTVTVYQLCTDGPSSEVPDDEDGGGDAGAIANYTQWELPNVGFEGLWESLVYDAPIKEGCVVAHAGLGVGEAHGAGSWRAARARGTHTTCAFPVHTSRRCARPLGAACCSTPTAACCSRTRASTATSSGGCGLAWLTGWLAGCHPADVRS
jgi:hypothetical protein